MATAAANPEISPLDFLLSIMRDPDVSLELRVRVAQAAAPFLHGKPGAARSNDPTAIAKSIDGAGGFTIDPILARTIRDDCQRLNELVQKRPLSATEDQEESWLRARITETAKAIGCPVGYGEVQARKDRSRLDHLYCRRISPPQCGGGPLPEAEDAEEAQLEARFQAYAAGPEGVARCRIRDLKLKSVGLTPAEQSELNDLQALYPPPPLDPDDPFQAMWIGRV
jgi:hypothetical protein